MDQQGLMDCCDICLGQPTSRSSAELCKKRQTISTINQKISLTPALIVLIDYVVDFAPSHLDRLPGCYKLMLQSHSAVTLFSI